MSTIYFCLFLIFFLYQQYLAFDSPPSILNNAAFQNNFKDNSFANLPHGDSSRSVQAKNDKNTDTNQLKATNFEIKAVLTKCTKPKPCDCENRFQCTSNETQNEYLRTKDYRTKCEEQADEKLLTNCEKKISLTLKIKNKGFANCMSQYLVLDHVFDPTTDKKQKLLNPYVLKITQTPVLQVYDLIFENVVNSGPTEKVINKNDEGFTGCSTDPSNPTCGSLKYNEKEVPYSNGFCCSCQSPNGAMVTTGQNFNDFTLEQNFDVTTNDPLVDINVNALPMGVSYLSASNKPNDESNDLTSVLGILNGSGLGTRTLRQLSNKDQVIKKRIHRRGGQDCDNKFTPIYADSDTYHDSAHCMEFSDVWYSIYKIAHAEIDHSLEIQIFEKVGMHENEIFWREVTSSGSISVGTANERYENKDGTILAYYSVDNKQIDNEFALDCKTSKLLIPEVTARDATENDYPEAHGGAAEYLVIQDKDIDLTGKTCNKAGVSYEAFAQQPNRCENDKNSCLQNQPRQMWQHDHDLEENGKKGCYFLKNHGILPENPVRSKPCNGSSKKTQNKLLAMYYLPCVSSSVNINFAADMNTVLRPDTLATITEVYSETLNPKRVTVTAKILNSGLVTSIFYVGISACPMEIPASFASITSQPVLIAPQNLHMFTLEIYCELPIKSFYCSLEVFNTKQQLVAVRRIRFERQDRCICIWYCQCTCFSSDTGMQCNPLEIEQYHAAGFQGGMPIATQVVNYSEFDDTISVILHIVLYFCLTLWYMGLIKALLGCCLLPIGLWGLDKILDLPKKLNKYYEQELQDQKVMYDDEGWPIHPETGKRVNNIAPATQFAINMVFFFVFPFAVCWNLCKKLLAPKYSTEDLFSDLDICKCRASEISLLKDYSLQNSTMKNSASNEKKPADKTQSNQLSKDTSKDPSKLAMYAEQVYQLSYENKTSEDLCSAAGPSCQSNKGNIETSTNQVQEVFKWSHNLILLLIEERLTREKEFNRPICKKKKLWQDIANNINKVTGIKVNGDMCHIKYRNLLATYKRNKKRTQQSGEGSISWEFYSKFDELLGHKVSILPCREILGDVDTTSKSPSQGIFSVNDLSSTETESTEQDGNRDEKNANKHTKGKRKMKQSIDLGEYLFHK